MKKLGKLKLNYLAQSDLNEKEMNVLVGGQGNCCCSCWAADMEGGSGTVQNRAANDDHDLTSIYGCGGDKDKGDGGNSGGGSDGWWQALFNKDCACTA